MRLEPPAPLGSMPVPVPALEETSSWPVRSKRRSSYVAGSPRSWCAVRTTVLPVGSVWEVVVYRRPVVSLPVVLVVAEL